MNCDGPKRFSREKFKMGGRHTKDRVHEVFILGVMVSRGMQTSSGSSSGSSHDVQSVVLERATLSHYQQVSVGMHPSGSDGIAAYLSRRRWLEYLAG